MSFVRKQGIMSGKKIMEYVHDDVQISYDTLFSIKKSNMIGSNTKSKLDSFYRDHPEYHQFFPSTTTTTEQ